MNQNRKNKRNRLITCALTVPTFCGMLSMIPIEANAVSVGEYNEISQSTKIVNGLLTDQEGNPIIGATVRVKEGTNGVISDIDGRFSIKVSNGQTLIFSFIGYETVERKVTSETQTINLRMAEKMAELDDVVVVGFGKQKKESVVGAISSVKPESFIVPSSSISTALAGRLGGVIAVQRSGEPGSDGADFWIRGIGTNGANSTPLILLDGVEVSAADLNNVQPDDIQSFSILKDASATALYGVRGANGVMIITTKEGVTNEKMTIKARVENSVSFNSYSYDMVDGPTYMKMYNEALKNDDPYSTPMYSEDKINGTIEGRDPYIYPNVNWKDAIFKGYTMNQRANVNISGGSKIASYYLSAGIYHDTGNFKDISGGSFNNNIDMKRYNFQANITAKVTKTTKVGLKLSTVVDDKNSPMVSASDTYSNIIKFTNPVNFPITFPKGTGPTGEETHIMYGNMEWGGFLYKNPYADIARGYQSYFASTIISTGTLNQDLSMITKGLTARALFSFKNVNANNITHSLTPYYYQISSVNDDGTYNLMSIGNPGTDYLGVGKSNSGSRNIYLEAAIDYKRTFGKHDVSAMLLYNQSQYDNAFPGNFFATLPNRNAGLAGRFTYNYDRRYHAEFNFGYNGTENFHESNRWGFFPSIALGYTVSNEKFFEPLTDVISSFKIRGSYGLVGNDAVGGDRFPYLTEITIGNGSKYVHGELLNVGYSGINFTRNGNKDAKWEIGYKGNIGVDIDLFNALSITVDYFNERRTGIFKKPQTVPTELGYGSAIPFFNLGEVKNSGIDASFNFNKAFSKDLIVNLMGNFVYAHNEVVKDEYPELIYPNLSRIGYPVHTIFGQTADGLFSSQEEIDNHPKQNYGPGPKPGDIKYVDMTNHIDNANVIDNNDLHPIGDPTVPEITYGFGGTLRYKKFDFGIFFQGVAKTSFIMAATAQAPFGRYNANVAKWIAEDYWSEETNPNPNAGYPRLSAVGNQNNQVNSTYWLRDGSFLKLKNAEIGYTTKYFRIYLNGNNLLTFSKFDLWDPEMGANGYYKYPTQRVFNLGIQFNFK